MEVIIISFIPTGSALSCNRSGSYRAKINAVQTEQLRRPNESFDQPKRRQPNYKKTIILQEEKKREK